MGKQKESPTVGEGSCDECIALFKRMAARGSKSAKVLLNPTSEAERRVPCPHRASADTVLRVVETAAHDTLIFANDVKHKLTREQMRDCLISLHQIGHFAFALVLMVNDETDMKRKAILLDVIRRAHIRAYENAQAVHTSGKMYAHELKEKGQ